MSHLFDLAGNWSVAALDLAIVLLLVALAARLLHTRNLFEAIVLFIAYGLTLSLAWVQVGAPNIALAEAALGAGVTGALFLNTFQRLAERSRSESGMVDPEHDDRPSGEAS